MPASSKGDFLRAEDLYNEAFGAPTVRRTELLSEAVRLCPEDARFRVALGDAYAEPECRDEAIVTRPEQPAPSLEDLRRMAAAARNVPLVPAVPALPHDPELEERMKGLSPREQFAEMRRQVEAMRPEPYDVARALAIYREAADASPDSPLPHLRLAEALRATDRPASVHHLERAAALDWENALPRYELALLSFQAGDDSGARAHLAGARPCREIRHAVLLPARPIPPLRAIHVVSTMGAHDFAGFSRMRELAFEIVRLAGVLQASDPPDAEGAAAIIHDGELLADRVMRSRPGQSISLLVGLAIHRLIASALLPRDQVSAARLRDREEALSQIPRNILAATQAFAGQHLGHTHEAEAPTAPWQDEEERVDRLLEGLDRPPKS